MKSHPKKKVALEDEGKSPSVFVGRLPRDATEDDVHELFAECGEIVSVRMPTDRETGQTKGIAFVDFADADAAAKACELNGTDLRGSTLNINPADQKPKAAPRDDTKTVFVKGFDRYQGEEEVRTQLTQAFAECGKVVNVRLPTYPDDGNLRGFAFIEFADANAVEKAGELNETEVAGGYITVDTNAGGGKPAGGRGRGRGDFGGRGGRGGRGRGDFGGRGGRGGRGRGDFGGRGGRGGARGRGRGGISLDAPKQNKKISFD